LNLHLHLQAFSLIESTNDNFFYKFSMDKYNILNTHTYQDLFEVHNPYMYIKLP
jgi:hypothetical protein